MYAKVLSLLRKEALVVHIKKNNVDTTKLLHRLGEICKNENLILPPGTLSNLCQKSKYYIRVCMNTLQFVSYNKQNITLLNSLSADQLSMLGRKDMSEGLFETWNKILVNNKNDENIKASPHNYFKAILNVYYAFGEFDNINNGIFINYPKVVTKNKSDSELTNRAQLLEYLSYDGILNHKIASSHSYDLLKFRAIPGAYVRKYYASDKKIEMLEFPTILIESKKNKKVNSRILKSINENYMENNIYSRVTKRALVCDILPYVFQLIQPDIKRNKL